MIPPIRLFLLVLLLSGCAGLEDGLPVLGETSSGRYLHPKGRFECPLPGRSLGFSGPVVIRDAAKIEKKRRVLRPNHSRALFEGPFVEETVYPIRYKASSTVRFSDPADETTRVEVSYRRLRTNESRAPVYRSGYGGGNYGLLLEEVLTQKGRTYGLALAQLPYFSKDQAYMGVNLWRSHLESDGPPPVLDTLINLISGDYHFFIQMRSSAAEFLSRQVNPRDLEAVYQALKSNAGLIAIKRQRALQWVEQCRFSDGE